MVRVRIRATPSGEPGISGRDSLAWWTAHPDELWRNRLAQAAPSSPAGAGSRPCAGGPNCSLREFRQRWRGLGLSGDDAVAGSGRGPNGVECALLHDVEINCENRHRRVVTAAAAVQASLGHARQILSSSALMQLVDTACSPPRLCGCMSGRTSNSLSVDRASGVRKAIIHPNSYDI